MYYFSKLNWITVGMCSRTFAQTMALIKRMLASPCDRPDSQRKYSYTVFSFLKMCIHFFLAPSVYKHSEEHIVSICRRKWQTAQCHNPATPNYIASLLWKPQISYTNTCHLKRLQMVRKEVGNFIIPLCYIIRRRRGLGNKK